jgi:hypothetical protein
MICLFVLFIALQSQTTDSTLVTNQPHVAARYLASKGTQPQQNATAITCDAKNRLADFAVAVQLAIQSLDKETYLDQDVPKTKLPPSIESISILDAEGKVKDSTISDFINKTHALPSSGKTKEGEYYIQLKSTSGIGWILIKTTAP